MAGSRLLTGSARGRDGDLGPHAWADVAVDAVAVQPSVVVACATSLDVLRGPAKPALALQGPGGNGRAAGKLGAPDYSNLLVSARESTHDVGRHGPAGRRRARRARRVPVAVVDIATPDRP